MARLEVLDKHRPLWRAPLRARRVALIGNYPPRRCGIATFTADLRSALIGADPELACDVYAMSDGRSRPYPCEVNFEIAQEDRSAYIEAARRIEASGVELVCLQHEFGIFGGDAGEHVLALLDHIRAPVVVTLHTVLAQPNEGQRRVLVRLARRAAKLVVMADRGRDILSSVYGVRPDRIAVIQHGAPDRPFADTGPCKRELGLDDRDVLLTFGLLSPGKGIGDMIRAMPRIVEASPNALYIVLGATHPALIAREGEAHRDMLAALARRLGVETNIRLVNAYVDHALLLKYLAAADIYVTPYLNEAQITSGTLAYAVALGKAVVSTPYWHAQELLAQDRGVLTPFSDPGALAHACIGLLTDPSRREAIRANAYAFGRGMIWPRVGERYVRLFSEAVRAPQHFRQIDAPIPEPSLLGVERFTDSTGIFQHGGHDLPDPAHGYCLDDNARALVLTLRLHHSGMRSPTLDRLETTYAAFVDRAWNEELGSFRNFMSAEGAWLEERGSCDSFGRAFWSLGAAARLAGKIRRRRWANTLAASALDPAAQMTSPRALAFTVLGLESFLHSRALRGKARDALHAASQRLLGFLREQRSQGSDWFESYLSYDNARLPEALVRAGAALADRQMIDAGLCALAWLCSVQTAPSGWFRPVGSESLGKPPFEILAFDQQPLEAAATIDACAAAFDATGDRSWISEARRAFDWYRGENDLGVRLVVPELGLCYDALTPYGPNLNHGAESILSFQLASVSMNELLEKASARPLRRGVDTDRFGNRASTAYAAW